MLKFLSIRNFVIVDLIELEFSSGFTALTGETGAGKSILIDALSLALGERGDAGMVRSGCDRAEISAEFDAGELLSLQAWLREQGLEGDEGVCLLRRVLDSNGRTRGFINGRNATLQQMREAGSHLLDIHGQHAHQSLLNSESQRDLLDNFAGIKQELTDLAQLYRCWQTLHKRRVQQEKIAHTTAAERDLLLFQKRELETLNFSVTSWNELQTDHSRLSHAASLEETALFGMDILSETDTACIKQLNGLISRVRTALAFDTSLQNILNMLESAQNELQETVYGLSRYQQKLDVDPHLQREHEQRMTDILDTARKYRVTPEQLPIALSQINERLDELGTEAERESLIQQEAVAHQAYLSAANKLGVTRSEAAQKLSSEITFAMQTLAMQGGIFAIEVTELNEGNEYGLQAVEFQVAANPGTPLKSMAKVASGGELSRISLAIQVAANQVATVPTLIFDEVDSGIGGSVAEIVGASLKQLGLRYQVLCVTHLPQVAAKANSQYLVSKSLHNGVTLSTITVLSPCERIEEIARMLGGVTLTETTRRHAVEMLGLCHNAA